MSVFLFSMGRDGTLLSKEGDLKFFELNKIKPSSIGSYLYSSYLPSLIEQIKRNPENKQFEQTIEINSIQFEIYFSLDLIKDIFIGYIKELKTNSIPKNQYFNDPTFFENILDNLPFGVQVFDSEGYSRFLNKKQCEILGLKEKESSIGRFNVLTDQFSVSNGASKVYHNVYTTKIGISRDFITDLSSVSNKWDTNKTEIIINETIIPILNDDYSLNSVMAVINDISELRKTELSLEEYKEAIEQSSDMIAIVDRDYVYHLANKSFIENRGLTSSDIVGRRVSEIEGEELFKTVIKNQIDLCFTGESLIFDSPFYDKRKGDIYLKFSYFPLKIKSEEINRVIVIISDITEKKTSENALIRSEMRLRSIFENANTGIVFINSNGNILSFNKAFEKISGYPADDLKSMNTSNFTDPEDYLVESVFINEMRDGIRDKYRLELRYIKNDGKINWVDLSISVIRDDIGMPMYFVGVASVINERKEAEAKLKISEERWKALFDQLGDAAYIMDLHGRFLDVNQQASEMLGFTKIEFMQMCINDIDFDFITREREKYFWESLPHDDFIMFEAFHRTVENVLIPVEIKMGFVETTGNLVILAMVRDISERKTAERALKQSESRLRQLLETSPIPTIIIDSKHDIIQFNRKFSEIIGYTFNDIKSINDLWKFSQTHSNIENNLSIIEDNDLSENQNNDFNQIKSSLIDLKCKNEEVRTFEINMPVIKDYGLVTFTDFTDRIKLEMDLQNLNDELEERVSERTSELENTYKKIENALKKEKQFSELQKRFIDLISHEYRTPLTVILTTASIIELKIKKNDLTDYKKYIDRITLSVDVLTQLMEDVLTFSKLEYENLTAFLRPVNIHDFLAQMISIIHTLDNGNHNLVINDFDKDLFVMSDQKYLRQVMTQLVLNAIKYSGAGTTIEINVSELINEAKISIKDEGYGISKEDMEHLFEPFFKSKESIGIKSGTGLGLSITKKLIEALDGRIEVESEQGKGSRFSIILKKK